LVQVKHFGYLKIEKSSKKPNKDISEKMKKRKSAITQKIEKFSKCTHQKWCAKKPTALLNFEW
jgi:hypothetical protein